MCPAARRTEPSPRDCATRDRADGGLAREAQTRRPHPQEDPSGGALSTALVEVERYRFPDVCKQGQALQNSALATDEDFARPPLDVAKLKGDHLSGAQTQPREEEEHCVVAAADRGRQVTGSQNLLYLLRRR